jgi:photosystem II stability/assembly factor-like uncharacterized protein
VARAGTAAATIVLAAILAVSGTAASGKPARLYFTWLHMTSARDGYALSRPDYRRQLLLRTSDGGRVWHEVTLRGRRIYPSAPPAIRGRTILLPRTVGRHSFEVDRSDDSGRTWSKSVPFRNPYGLNADTPRAVGRAHLYLDVGEGAAAGSEGEALYTSSDGGRWRLVTQTHVNGTPPGGLPFGCDKNGFGFATPRRGWAGGYCAGGSLFFLRTNDGGRHWHRQKLPGAPKGCSCEASTPIFFGHRVGVVWVSGESDVAGKWFARLYWTNDGGDHWRGTDPGSRRTGLVDVVNRRVVWLFGRLSGDAPRFPRLFRTTDAGHHWSSLHVPVTVSSDGALDAVTATLGFAASKAVIWRTADGGRHWTAIHAVIGQR